MVVLDVAEEGVSEDETEASALFASAALPMEVARHRMPSVNVEGSS